MGVRVGVGWGRAGVGVEGVIAISCSRIHQMERQNKHTMVRIIIINLFHSSFFFLQMLCTKSRKKCSLVQKIVIIHVTITFYMNIFKLRPLYIRESVRESF